MSALKDYIKQRNAWNGLFGEKPMAMPTTPKEAEAVIFIVEGELSPENLWCDGEASPAHVRREIKRLGAVMSELEAIA